MKLKKELQLDNRDCGVACLSSIVRYYGGYVRYEYLREITKTSTNGVSVYSLIMCAKTLGFEARALKGNIKNIKDRIPFIAHVMKDNKLGHFVVVTKISDKAITVMDPSCGFKTYLFDDWNNITTNVYLLYKPINEILKQTKEQSFFKTIFSLINKYKLTLKIILLFSFIYSISEICISIGLKKLINYNYITIKYILILLILILVLKELSNLFRNYLINYLIHILDNTIIKEIYNHLIRLPYLYFKNHTKGDILTRINDTFKIRDLISKLFVTIFIDLIFIIIILLVIFNINYKIGLFTLLITFVYIILITIYNYIITEKIKDIKEKEVIVNNHLIESISSIETIKGMAIEDLLSNQLDIKYNNLQNSSFNLNKTYYKELFLKELIKEIFILLIIYISIVNNNNNIGEILVLFSLFNCYFEPINNICSLNLDYKEAFISYKRIKELLSSEPEYLNIDNKSINKRLLGNIKISNLEYSYNGIDNTIKCSNLVIENNNKVLLYGDSGGGKSTLVKLLNRYLDNYKGKIEIDNRDLKTYNLLDIRKKITYVSSNEIIYTDTIYNNIILDNEYDYLKYLEIIKICSLDKIINRSLLTDQMILENNGSNLSSGERQRIIIARSLMKNSDIYIFDEATNALDIKSERNLLEKIFKYLKNKTVIVISHRFNNRDLYQKFIMVKGGIVYDY